MRRLTPDLSTILARAGGYLLALALGILSLLLLLVLVIYTVAYPEPLIGGFLGVVPAGRRARAERALRRSMEQIKHWVFATLVMGAIMGVVTWVGLRLLGVPYPLLFGLLAVACEAIPVLGPYLSGIPPVLLALTIDPLLALWVALFFLAIEQLEANVLGPLILGRHLKLHPVSLIFTLLVMHSLFGLLGAVLAVPVCAILKVCWEEFGLDPATAAAREAGARAIVRGDGSEGSALGPPVTRGAERAA